MRPQAFYRQVFRDLILAERPESLLDVGCGDGGLLRAMLAAGIRAEGVDVDADRITGLRTAGLTASRADAGLLPFPPGAFDVVASEFSAHHFADLAQHLAEALRVARRAVFVLDQWYDLTIPSQRTAARWDRWFKGLDRRRSMVHHDVIAAEAFRRALPAGSTVSFGCQHLLQVVPIDAAHFARETAPYLEQAASLPGTLAELAAIREDMARDGLSDDGAIVVVLRRSE